MPFLRTGGVRMRCIQSLGSMAPLRRRPSSRDSTYCLSSGNGAGEDGVSTQWEAPVCRASIIHCRAS